MFNIARYVIGAGLIFGATAAVAGDLRPDTADSIMDACRSDYHRICSEVVPGDGRVARCLMDHERDLAPYCLQSLKSASAAEDCMPDYQRFCPDVPKGQEAFRCLAQRMERLEPACRRVVAANAPYMQPRGDRYSSNEGPAPYGPRPYPDRAPYPYEGPYPGPYAYDGYSGPAEPQGRPYGGYAGFGERRDAPRYGAGAYGDEAPRGDSRSGDSYHYGPGYGGQYAGDGTPRFKPWEEEDEGNYATPPRDGPRPRY